MDIVCVTIDCRDRRRVATFWNEALGWGGVELAADGSGAVCRPAGAGPYLEFVRVPEDKVVKNRVHLGCSAGALEDLDAEIERLVALGATIAWEEEFPPEVAAGYRNLVLRDPEGNEFCFSAGAYPDVIEMRRPTGGRDAPRPWGSSTQLLPSVADDRLARL